MTLKRLSDRELATLERSLLTGPVRGVPFSLADVRSEIRRRQKHEWDPRRVAATILEQALSSPDGLTTYGELWNVLTDGKPWRGNAPRTVMARELGQVLAYCHQNGLPLLTVLVVTQADRSLSELAINGICQECIELGIDVGPDRRAFVEAQTAKSRKVAISMLPSS